jgi:2-succinyl-5-enolpyruvyl-6-hydroxy-3-cyclohexene-1-carboxylate synthase
MTSDKKGAALLAGIFAQKGLTHIVISPGSRNAPLVIAFASHPAITSLSMIDERSAAYFALGMAQQTGKTVAVACTSGTAALNFAPAIAEAYYQRIPLLVLTADRPPEWIDQADGQTIRQRNLYANYVKKSFEVPREIGSPTLARYTQRIISEAINLSCYPEGGPVHINIPFDEPLYDLADERTGPAPVIDMLQPEYRMAEKDLRQLVARWNGFEKKLIMAGMMPHDERLNEVLSRIALDESVTVLTETTSNLSGDLFFPCIDRVVSTFTEEDKEAFKPGLLVTFGGPVISKMVRAFLRRHRPAEHWHVDVSCPHPDTYLSLTHSIPSTPLAFFERLMPRITRLDSGYHERWKTRDRLTCGNHETYLASCPYSDLKVFEACLEAVPAGSNLHLGNSTPVRYAQLFKHNHLILFNANRGVSGIDGTVSTAAGAAYATGKPTTLITGDLGFFYDSNGLMNRYLSKDFRIIVINNAGGGIFRFLDGPSRTGFLEDFFETRHNLRAEHLVKTFNLEYYEAHDMKSLSAALRAFYQPHGTAAVLEVFTPAETNAVILKDYFRHLKKGICGSVVSAQ